MEVAEDTGVAAVVEAVVVDGQDRTLLPSAAIDAGKSFLRRGVARSTVSLPKRCGSEGIFSRGNYNARIDLDFTSDGSIRKNRTTLGSQGDGSTKRRVIPECGIPPADLDT